MKVNGTNLTLINLIKLYGEELGKEKYTILIKEKGTYSLEAFIIRYGEDIGKEKHLKWIETRKNASKKAAEKREKGHCSLEHFIRLYGEEEGKKRYKKRQEPITSLEAFITRHGEEEGTKRYKNSCEKRKFSNTLEGYILRYGKEEGTLKHELMKVRKSNSKTLENFIRIYGEEEGNEAFKNFKNMCKYVQSSQYYIDKYGEEDGLIKWKDLTYRKIKNSLHSGYSKVSQVLFFEILEFIKDKQCVNFALHNKETRINNFLVDFCYGNKIIEFYGDLWHANPKFFKKEDICVPWKSLISKDIWEKDKKRINFIKDQGYEVFIIWESEYNENKEMAINKCLNFLNLENNEEKKENAISYFFGEVA